MIDVDMPLADAAEARELERIRWRARRGLLELDLILARFFDRSLATLTRAELEQLKRLLALQDNDLLDICMARSDAFEPALRPLVERIRAA